jgi:cytoskeletal protein CcmA (bactofilin family)
MFNKNSEKLESFIGANSTLRGDIETSGTLKVDGIVEGNIAADWVVLGDKAHIKGDITSRGIVVGGRVDGNLKAKEIVEIKSKGQLFGEIFTSRLVVSEGGIFDGRSRMHHEDSAKVIEFQPLDKTRQG